ncbi:MAG: hypothetical protein COA58_13165 [Bacteroidetes bacterium]|nr:MAG: hypothetical protein COA58_13165 [Bacteroidota bacterium]
MDTIENPNLTNEDTTESQFEEFDTLKRRRRQLLPWWIKIFCWIFMIMGVFSLISVGFGILSIQTNLAFYGFETKEAFSLTGILVISVAFFKGISAYSLWFEKDIAIKLCKADAIIGIILSVISMLVIPFFNEGGFNLQIRLELALLIPFLIRLNKIQKEWEGIITY